MASSIREFKTKNGEFERRTRRRVLYEILILALIAIYFGSPWSSRIPSWFEWSVVVLFSSYIAFGLLLYRKSKAIAQSLAIVLREDGLTFFDGSTNRHLAYSDLRISKIKRNSGDITEVWLETSWRQTIKLKGFQNMRELHDRLVSYLSKP
jgi:hypothetical protein